MSNVIGPQIQTTSADWTETINQPWMSVAQNLLDGEVIQLQKCSTNTNLLKHDRANTANIGNWNKLTVSSMALFRFSRK